VDDLRAVDEFASADTVAAVFAEWPNLGEALDQAAGTDLAVDALHLVNALHTPWLARAWLREALLGTGRRAEARALLDAVYEETPIGGVPWLAARALSAALTLAEGDVETARLLADQLAGTYRVRGSARTRSRWACR
jgi:hypothetical protein